MQSTTLTKTFAAPSMKFPRRKISNVSKLKVENVLKPPQNPTIINMRKLLSWSFVAKTESAMPMITQLSTFEINVAIGNAVSENCFTPIETPKRARLPSPPPKKISSIVWSMMQK